MVPGPLEVAANLATTVSILLAARNSLHTWWTGIAGCSLFAVLFGQQRLYADAVLQFFFIVTSALGWWRWAGGRGGVPMPVTRAPRRELVASLAVAVFVTLAYGTALHHWTDAYAPYPDSAVLGVSVVAQWLLMSRRIETWPAWLMVNTIAVPLFASRGLWLTAGLYAAYWCNAWFGWWRWRRLGAVQ